MSDHFRISSQLPKHLPNQHAGEERQQRQGDQQRDQNDVASLLVALFGIFCAYSVYLKKWVTAESLGKAFGPLYTMVFNKYFFDELYENIIVKLALIKGLFNGFEIFDRRGVDGAVNGVSDVIMGGGRAIRRAQTGQLQLYGLFIGIGVAIIALCVYLFG